jgi:hypothetical protein
MHIENAHGILRRSSRIPTAVQILVTSLEGMPFSEVCETLVVNAHGCAILTRAKLEAGIPLHFHSQDGRETMAHVVSCQPMSPDHRAWRLAAKLDHPENFWGLRDCPKDWALQMVQTRPPQILKSVSTPAPQLSGQFNLPSEAVFDRMAQQLEGQVRKIITEMVRPLHAEIKVLKERLARREANPSRFEVSLSSIPVELQQQIESRLRNDLGPMVVDEARQQSAQLLATAKATLDQRASEAHDKFLRRVGEELSVVERQARDISTHLSEHTQEHLRNGLEDFRRTLVEGGNSLKRLGDELFDFLQIKLNDEYEVRRGELEQLRAAVTAESARLREQIEYLDTRVAKLDESVRSLESGLDHRLGRMSSETVKDTRSQFEVAANEVLEELTARSVQVLGDQLEETNERLKTTQNEIVAGVSEELKGQTANVLQSLERSVEQLSRASVERWRLKLDGAFSALSKNLNEQFRLESEHSGQ